MTAAAIPAIVVSCYSTRGEDFVPPPLLSRLWLDGDKFALDDKRHLVGLLTLIGHPPEKTFEVDALGLQADVHSTIGVTVDV